ncbi:hypothetical protein NFI96_002616 [Prochilodus magdalenae]|nr:hypothetical protein NFI96_002616 [Prochilodus magdalenae]
MAESKTHIKQAELNVDLVGKAGPLFHSQEGFCIVPRQSGVQLSVSSTLGLKKTAKLKNSYIDYSIQENSKFPHEQNKPDNYQKYSNLRVAFQTFKLPQDRMGYHLKSLLSSSQSDTSFWVQLFDDECIFPLPIAVIKANDYSDVFVLNCEKIPAIPSNMPLHYKILGRENQQTINYEC